MEVNERAGVWGSGGGPSLNDPLPQSRGEMASHASEGPVIIPPADNPDDWGGADGSDDVDELEDEDQDSGEDDDDEEDVLSYA
jgi:hypothetical protein